MHKTGGQTLNDLIMRSVLEHEVIGYHYPHTEVPANHKNLPLVGIVRNPWDWYISWYAFNNTPKLRNPIFAIVSDNGRADLNTTIANLINLGSEDKLSQQHRKLLIEVLPETLEHNQGVGLTKDDIRSYPNTNIGYYSWMFQRMFGYYASDKTHIGKFENLQQDFLDIMDDLGVEETSVMENEFDKKQKKNASQHSHYSHYYNTALQELVASKDQQLIDDFNYQFETVGPSKVVNENKVTLHAGKQDFQKLLGRANNYLKLHDNYDVSAIKELLEDIPISKWRESGREKRFDVHRHTEALLLIKFEDFRFTTPEFSDLYKRFQHVTQPVIEHISKYYQDNGFVVRMVFAKLLAGGNIPEHSDSGYSLLNCHRIHIPIVSNDKNIFVVGGEQKIMQVGEFWEINNAGPHAVNNDSDEDRIHLIVDWVPNPEGKPVTEAVLSPDQGVANATKPPDIEELNTMVADAYQMHRQGQVKQAKSIYRTVLDFEPNHVVSNNLLGLLCLQTGEFDRAIEYISTALSVNPDDPQAHANIGLAYQELKQIEQAIHHFQQSLNLAPNNPGTRNNLGNMYKALGQLDKAVECYQGALMVKANHLEAKHNLGSTLSLLGRNAEAVEILKQALVLKPDFKPTQIELEKALEKMRIEN
jgi:tetratricopeptide (TPR) repeat protein